MFDKGRVDFGLRNLSALIFFPHGRNMAYPCCLERAEPVRRDGHMSLLALERQGNALRGWELRGAVQVGDGCVLGLCDFGGLLYGVHVDEGCFFFGSRGYRYGGIGHGCVCKRFRRAHKGGGRFCHGVGCGGVKSRRCVERMGRYEAGGSTLATVVRSFFCSFCSESFF